MPSTKRGHRRGNYGAFLMDQLPLVESLVRSLAARCTVPVTAKIRVFPRLEDTLAYARMIQVTTSSELSSFLSRLLCLGVGDVRQAGAICNAHSEQL
jgi:hypothetical protein